MSMDMVEKIEFEKKKKKGVGYQRVLLAVTGSVCGTDASVSSVDPLLI